MTHTPENPTGQHPGQQSFPHQQPPPPGWTYQLAPVKPPSSGYRVAAGIISIVLSLWVTLFYFVTTTRFSYYFQPGATDLILMTLWFICMWGCFVCGIILLVKHRRRGKVVPSLVGASAACGLLGFAMQTGYFPTLIQLLSMLASASVIALVVIDMRRRPAVN
jgi:hypothetical protein